MAPSWVADASGMSLKSILRAVRRFERLGNLLCNGQSLVEGDRAARDALRQILALDQFHDEGQSAAGLLDGMDRGNVGMVERRQRLGPRSKRARRSGSAANASGRILMATWRPSEVSVARHT
jgi:hypothetical protein